MPGQSKLVAQCDHIGRDQAEVLREDWQPAQCLPQSFEEHDPRTIDPIPVPRGLLAGRDVPRLNEAAEVIEPDQDRPGSSCRLMRATHHAKPVSFIRAQS